MQNAANCLAAFCLNMAEEQGFEPWVGYKPTPVFKTGALNHSATPPNERDNSDLLCRCKLKFIAK